MTDPPSSSQLGSYELCEVIARGGMGTVYRARHVETGEPYAIKLLRDDYATDEELRARMLREGWAAARVRHPNIVEVVECGAIPGGSTYLAMEYLTGERLSDVLKRCGRWPLMGAIAIVRQLARALDAVHREQIVHRDVKPQNVMLLDRAARLRTLALRHDGADEARLQLERENSIELVKLLDFGVAKLLERGTRRLTQVGCSLGTPEYMAPESIRGADATPAFDIYALGMTFYELLTGQLPFRRDDALATLGAVMTEPAPPPSTLVPEAEVSPEAERLILRTLAKRPEQRPQSMVEVVAELDACEAAYRRTLTAEQRPAGSGAIVLWPPARSAPPYRAD